jgi:hypothetical protein
MPEAKQVIVGEAKQMNFESARKFWERVRQDLLLWLKHEQNEQRRSDHREVKISNSQKTGRPVTGKAPVKTLRMPPDLAARIDRWAKANGKESHSEAMRHLLELALRAPMQRRAQ